MIKLIRKYNKNYQYLNLIFLFLCVVTTKLHFVNSLILIGWFICLLAYIATYFIFHHNQKKYFKTVETEISSRMNSLTKKQLADYFEMSKFFDPLRELARNVAETLDVADSYCLANVWYEPVPDCDNKYSVEIELNLKSKEYFISIDEMGTVSFKKK